MNLLNVVNDFLKEQVTKLKKILPIEQGRDLIKRLLSRINLPLFVWIFKNPGKLNAYKNIREKSIRRYLKKAASLEGRSLIAWQPVLWIFVKIGLLLFISYRLYLFHPIVAGWLEEGLKFFRLSEIYNFDFPGKSSFLTISSYLFLFILGYHGLYFLYYQLQALFSSVVISESEKKVYYIRSSLVKKDLFIFTIPEIDLVVMEQNLLFRPFKMGNLNLFKKSGEKIVVTSLKEAPGLVKMISEIKKGGEVLVP